MTNYKPLTPKFRSEILDSINSQVSELNACQENVFVSAQRVGLDALQNLIKALPDGYPIPLKDGDTVIVYQKKDAKEHLSTMDKDYRLVREFIKGKRKQSNADRIRDMTDEELEDFLFSIYTEKIKDYGFIRHISGRSFEFPFEVLDWLKQPVEE